MNATLAQPPPPSDTSAKSDQSETPHIFELVLEYGRPAAAIIHQPIPLPMLISIYALLPHDSSECRDLATHWKVWRVLRSNASASSLRRRTRPEHTIKLQFL